MAKESKQEQNREINRALAEWLDKSLRADDSLPTHVLYDQKRLNLLAKNMKVHPSAIYKLMAENNPRNFHVRDVLIIQETFGVPLPKILGKK